MSKTKFHSRGLMDLSAYSLRVVTSADIWDHFVESSDQGTLFNLTSFTSSFAKPVTNFGCFKGQELVGGISLLEDEKNSGVRHDLVIYNSFMLRQGDAQQASANQFAEQFRTTAAMTRELTARYNVLDFQTHYKFSDTRPIEWHNYGTDLPKFEIYPRHTSIVSLAKSKGFDGDPTNSPVYLQCSKSRRQEIRYGIAKGVTVLRDFAPQLLSSLLYSTFERQGIAVKEPYVKQVLQTCAALDSAGMLHMYVATDGAGQVGSLAVFGIDSKRAYYLYGANSELARECPTGSMVLFSALLDLSRHGVVEVDLEGINSPSRGHFKTSFGGTIQTYYAIKYRDE